MTIPIGLLSLIYGSLVIASPVTSLTQDSTTLLNATSRALVCAPGSSTVNSLMSDCGKVILKLPASHSTGRFHSSSPLDRYSLPKTESFGSCQVQVAMKQGVAGDYGAWFDLGVVSTQLSIACLDFQKGSTGRSVTAGDRDGIEITLSGTGIAVEDQ